ncbi:MAG: ParA family protein [Deltaproteobacteria bacterium]|nr:MAG: ParA family protein [Deltaproteobacteria bacterium]
MARVISMANQKGGVGKTTSTLNLGAALLERGFSVLLVDLDPQGSLTTSLGEDPEEIEQTLYSALLASIEEREFPLSEVTYVLDNELEFIPANIELSAAELDLSKATMGEMVLRDVLEAVDEDYDFILIDCPPNLGLLTINALSASDEVIIPLQADYLALKGVNLLMRTISTVKRKINPSLKIAGVMLTMADLRTLHAREVVAAARSALEGQVHVFEPVVRMNVRMKEASVASESILTYASGSNVARAYRQLAEILTHGEA